MADLHLEQKYDESNRQFLCKFTKVTDHIHDLDSKQATIFFVQGLINGSLIHERFIDSPPMDMNEVRSRADGILHVEEKKQRIAKSATIVVAQNNVLSKPLKHQEVKGKTTKVNWKV